MLVDLIVAGNHSRTLLVNKLFNSGPFHHPFFTPPPFIKLEVSLLNFRFLGEYRREKWEKVVKLENWDFRLGPVFREFSYRDLLWFNELT